jgi:shikimate 5-dehydrogenase
MHVTLIGTGNMARGLGRRVLAGGHDLTVVGKDEQRAEAVAADLGGQGRVGPAVDGDPIEARWSSLPSTTPTLARPSSSTPTSSPGRSSRHHEPRQCDVRGLGGTA